MYKPIVFRLLTIVYLVFLLSHLVQAQKGYVITTSGDSIVLNPIQLSGTDRYSQVSGYRNGKTYELPASEVARAGKPDGFCLKYNESDGLLWEVIFEGQISAYQRNDHVYFVNDTTTIIVKKSNKSYSYASSMSSKVYRSNDRRWKRQLADMSADCLEDTRDIAKVSMTSVSIEKFLTKYHECKGIPYKRYTNKPNRVIVEPFISARYGRASTQLQGPQFLNKSGEPTTASNEIIGAGAWIRMGNRASRLSIVPEISYLQNAILFTEESEDGNDVYDVFFKENSIQFPLSIQYNFKTNNQGPYVSVGALAEVIISSDSELHVEQKSSSVITLENIPLVHEDGNNLGWQAGLGYTLIFGNIKVQPEVSYRRSIRSPNLGNRIDVNYQEIGVSFKIGLHAQ